MNLRTLTDALGDIDSRHVEAADHVKPRGRLPVRAIAAVLALAVAVGGFAFWKVNSLKAPGDGLVLPKTVTRLASPVYPQRVQYAKDTTSERAKEKNQLRLTKEETAAFASFLDAAVPALLNGREGENAVCSPMNLYFALSMLCETAGGETRRQILDLLGQESVGDVRALTNRAWNALYVADGVNTLELANSIWLRDGTAYGEEVLKTLAEDYYASVFSGTMGSGDYNKALQEWLDVHTGGLLSKEAGDVELAPETVMALVSTVYFKDKWTFNKDLTEEGDFHGPDGDVTVSFMHTSISQGTYYWDERFSAIILGMEGGSRMVLLLPDEGVTPEELLGDVQAVAFLNGRPESTPHGTYKILVTMPRFDVKDDMDLQSALNALGVTDAFDPNAADFTPLGVNTPDPLYVSHGIQAVRVKVDEEGCEGASYTVFTVTNPTSAEPGEDQEVIFFKLDRPFLFAVLKDGLPVFTGIVNDP